MMGGAFVLLHLLLIAIAESALPEFPVQVNSSAIYCFHEEPSPAYEEPRPSVSAHHQLPIVRGGLAKSNDVRPTSR